MSEVLVQIKCARLGKLVWLFRFRRIMQISAFLATIIICIVQVSPRHGFWSSGRHLLKVTDTPGLNDIAATFQPSLPVSFGTDNSTVITVQSGTTALIPCVVFNIGDGMVSWIRRKEDYHLLTVGSTTYTGDDRYQAIHAQNSEDWTLQIKFVQMRDAGLYECQVSSHPSISLFIDLKVVEARAAISGPPEMFLKPGSPLRLSCTLMQSTEPPQFVFWYHNNRMINYDNDRGVNVTTDLVEKTSSLYISSAHPEHTGNYSCVPNNAQPASTVVHILNGENLAAMQHGRGRGLSWLSNRNSAILLFLCILYSLTTS